MGIANNENKEEISITVAGSNGEDIKKQDIPYNVLSDKGYMDKIDELKEMFLAINPDLKYDGTGEDRTIVWTFIGQTGIRQASKYKKFIDHANDTDGLGNIKAIVIDSSYGVYNKFKNDLPDDHVWIKIGPDKDDKIDGFGSAITTENEKLFEKYVTEAYKNKGIFNDDFGVEGMYHVVSLSTGGGTGGAGFRYMLNMYAERNQPVIFNAVTDNTDSVRGGNATKAYSYASDMVYSHVHDYDYPFIINFNENGINGKNAVDNLGLSQVLTMSIMLSGEAGNVDNAEVLKRFYASNAIKIRTSMSEENDPIMFRTHVVLGEMSDEDQANAWATVLIDDDNNPVKVKLTETITNSMEAEFKKPLISKGLSFITSVHDDTYTESLGKGFSESINTIHNKFNSVHKNRPMDTKKTLKKLSGVSGLF